MTNDERAERFNRALVTFDELSQGILKGHLLIEEELSAILDKLVGNPDIVSEARLTFYQKLKLVEAAFNKRLRSENWRAIEKLNSIRNQAAHQLDSPKVQKLILELTSVLKWKAEQNPAITSTKEYQIETLALALIIIYGDLCQLRESL